MLERRSGAWCLLARWAAAMVWCVCLNACGRGDAAGQDAAGQDAAVQDAAGHDVGTVDAAPALDAAWDAGGECIFVDPIDLSPYVRTDVHVYGSGLEAFDGQRLRVVTMIWDVAPLAVAETTIADGAFDLTLVDGVVDYTGLGVYIDLNNDSRCDRDEPMHERTTGTSNLPQEVMLGADAFEVGDCLVNGGVGDLTQPYSCMP